MPKMAIFCKENLSNSSKRCKLFSLALKEAFSICRTCNRRHLSHSSPDSEEETPTSDFDDVQEVVTYVHNIYFLFSLCSLEMGNGLGSHWANQVESGFGPLN